MRGHTVLDRDGQEIGEVDGLLIDRDERRVRLLQVASGGFLGIGKQKILVPVDAVTDVNENVHIDTDREHVANGPAYDPELAVDQPTVNDLHGYYGYLPYWGAGYLSSRTTWAHPKAGLIRVRATRLAGRAGGTRSMILPPVRHLRRASPAAVSASPVTRPGD